jgi:two-component system, OmpR family, sensor histidine kinase KdpD
VARTVDPDRPDPESFLRAASREEKRGRLKVYLGMAAGVGKTYRMLLDAHAMRERGVDVVVGFVETHGREETAEQIGDLETVPRKVLEYQGVRLEEMDLEAVLSRRPEVVLVDELAHTNVPGSRNSKRWQDVDEILAAGISVMAAMNVQHLESVEEVVRSATGVEIRERVPDRVVHDADAVVDVDLPVSELQERLRLGKVYPPEQARLALGNFFREENLKRLRELALRQTADYSEREVTEADRAPTAPVAPRLVVAFPFDPAVAGALLRRASQTAGRMNTSWYALYVRRRRDRPENLSAVEHRKFTEIIQLAITLGATVVSRESEDVVGEILRFVREEGVRVLIVGRPSRRALLGRFVPGIVARLLDQADGIDLVVADVGRE